MLTEVHKMILTAFLSLWHVYMCVSACGFVHMSAVTVEARRSHLIPWAGVTGLRELPNEGAGNQGPLGGQQGLLTLSHLSSPDVYLQLFKGNTFFFKKENYTSFDFYFIMIHGRDGTQVLHIDDFDIAQNRKTAWSIPWPTSLSPADHWGFF